MKRTDSEKPSYIFKYQILKYFAFNWIEVAQQPSFVQSLLFLPAECVPLYNPELMHQIPVEISSEVFCLSQNYHEDV